MSDFVDFLNQFNSKEAFTRQLIEAARGGLPDEVYAVREVVDDLLADQKGEVEVKKHLVLARHKLVQESDDIDPQLRYKFVCDSASDEDALIDVASMNAARLKAEILGLEVLDLPLEHDLTNKRSWFHSEITVNEYYKAERLFN